MASTLDFTLSNLVSSGVDSNLTISANWFNLAKSYKINILKLKKINILKRQFKDEMQRVLMKQRIL
ncbi:MAG: hypothetical protein WCO45_02400, partial [Pseudanabaena sp. ELA607]